MIAVEIGLLPKRYPVDREQYMRGYRLGIDKRYLLSATELRRQTTDPVNDSFTEGWQDALNGKEPAYGPV